MTQRKKYEKWMIFNKNMASVRRNGHPVHISDISQAKEDAEMFEEIAELLEAIIERMPTHESD